MYIDFMATQMGQDRHHSLNRETNVGLVGVRP